MAWTVPMTFIDGTVLTASQLNTNLRDNFLETVPAKSTGNGGAGAGYFSVQGPYQLAERGIAYHEVNSSQTTTQNSFANLATVGPTVSVITGTHAWVLFSAEQGSNVNGKETSVSVEVSGATTIEADDNNSVTLSSGNGSRNSRTHFAVFTDLTPGRNIFTLKYKVADDGATGTFLNRRIWVMAQ